MARRVLGNDPFASTPKTPAVAPDKRADKSVSAKKSTAKPAKHAKPAVSHATAKSKSKPEHEAAPEPTKPPEREVLAATESVPPGERESLIAAYAGDLPPDLARPAVPDEAPVVEAESAGSQGQADAPVAERIRAVEARIDELLDQVRSRGGEAVTVHVDDVAAKLRTSDRAVADDTDDGVSAESAGEVFDAARELLGSDYYVRQWGRGAMRDRSEQVDEFGLDPKVEQRWRAFFDTLYTKWWRVETQGIEHVPDEGRVILCANHSGALPYDGAMLATALRREHPQHRQLRWLAEDFIFHFPFVGVFMNRIGAVRACQENAARLLAREACVGVFPEGVKGVSKRFAQRYKLQRFGRGGHVKLALRTRTPIVPVAVVGAEEATPALASPFDLGKLIGLPYVPVTPTFPWLGPLGLVPLPSKWRIRFLEPIALDGYGPDAAEDDVLVGRLNEKIRAQIQDALDAMVRARTSVWRG